jgi:hypothetical protein
LWNLSCAISCGDAVVPMGYSLLKGRRRKKG